MKPWIVAAALALGLSGGAASAQAVSDSSAPVDISADESEVLNSQCLSIWRGNVEVLQDKTRLRASRMTVYYQKRSGDGGCSATADRIVAEGNVFYVTQEQAVRGDMAVYQYAADTITISGDVIAVQGQDVVRGDRMTIKVRTNDVKMESNAKGRGKSGRVRAVIYPDAKKNAAGKP